MTSEEVNLTLPGTETAISAYSKLRGQTKAVEFTLGDRTGQAGFITDFRLERQDNLSLSVAATVYSDAVLDLETGDTLTFSEASIGTLTITGRTQTILLPLFF